MAQDKNYLTIQQNGENEIIIKKSRFIANFFRCETIAAAETFIKETKAKYRDANHNTFAYTIGLDDNHAKASDDGEPSGTAGVPELKALQLMNLKNVAVVVTRYFGGVKLGAGGLIRAYSNSVTQAAEALGVVKCVMQQGLQFAFAYNRLDEVNHYLTQQQILVSKIDYGVNVTISLFIDEEKKQLLIDDLTNLLNGRVTFTILEKRFNEIPLTDHNYHEK